MKFRIPLSLLFVLFIPLFSAAQQVSLNAAEIKQGLEALRVGGSVLYLAAHPDDENTRLLAYLAKEKKVRTAYLSLTRGDGGQNLIGTAQADLLGLLRTQELLAARAIDGAEQFFTRANDFGFSKNPEESFQIWDKQKILSDVVWVIRQFRPQLIITRFPPDARAGHGHHTASAMLAQEAFKAAADPTRFPEQLKYVKPWQVKRLVWNTFNFGGNNTTAEDQIKLDVGGYNALLGKGYGEISAESRSKHRSQGFGSAAQRGGSTEYFSHVAGSPAQKDLFEGLDFSLDKAAGNKAVEELLQQINAQYDVADPAASLSLLLQLKEKSSGLVSFKHELLNELILACAGLWIETSTPQPAYAQTDEIPLKLQAIARGNTDLPISINGRVLKRNQMLDLDLSIPAGSFAPTQPYWMQQVHPPGHYIVNDLHLIGRPEAAAPSAAAVKVNIGGQAFELRPALIHKYTDPAIGEIYQPVVIAPPVTASFAEKAVVFNGNESKAFVVKLKSFKDAAKGVVKPRIPKGWKVSPQIYDFNIAASGMEETVVFTLTPQGTQDTGTLALEILVDGKKYDRGLEVIRETHIPPQTTFPLAEVKVSRATLKLGGRRIGYLAGAGDLVAECLKDIGYEITMLTANQALYQDLSLYDAIVTGVRFYNVNNQAAQLQPKLMKYVADGGTLVQQYNVNTPLKIQALGPYPFSLSRERVTEEAAPVKFLAAAHQVLNYPNKITAKDFEGWVQERGLYFATSADPKYTTVLSMHDQDEAPASGSLLVAAYGKGKYVYTGLSFFRELPAGVPGAFRLFINLLAKDEN